MTALHVVAGCSKITVQYKANAERNAEVKKAFGYADLALLQVKEPPPGVEPLEESTRVPAVADTVWVYGFPVDTPTTAQDYPLQVKDTNVEAYHLGDTLPTAERERIKERGSPSLDLQVLQTAGTTRHGLSGAPVVNRQGLVVGIQNGGLADGTVSIGWSVRARYLQEWPEKDDTKLRLPGASALQYAAMFDVLEPPTGALRRKKCGYLDFVHTKTSTLAQLSSTSADRDGLMKLVRDSGLRFAQVEGTRFDVWVDLWSGAGAALPAGAILESDGRNCYARTDNRDGRLVFGGAPIMDGKYDDENWMRSTVFPTWDRFTKDVSDSVKLNWPAEVWRVDGISDPHESLNPDFDLVVDRRAATFRSWSGIQWEVFQSAMASHDRFLGIAFARSLGAADTDTERRQCRRAADTDTERRQCLIGRLAVRLSTFPPRR